MEHTARAAPHKFSIVSQEQTKFCVPLCYSYSLDNYVDLHDLKLCSDCSA